MAVWQCGIFLAMVGGIPNLFTSGTQNEKTGPLFGAKLWRYYMIYCKIRRNLAKHGGGKQKYKFSNPP